jgi:hypothetical protein
MHPPVDIESGRIHLRHSASSACFGRDLSPRKALWPALMGAASTGRTHGSTDQAEASIKEKLCQGRAVHTWRLAVLFRPLWVISECGVYSRELSTVATKRGTEIGIANIFVTATRTYPLLVALHACCRTGDNRNRLQLVRSGL